MTVALTNKDSTQLPVSLGVNTPPLTGKNHTNQFRVISPDDLKRIDAEILKNRTAAKAAGARACRAAMLLPVAFIAIIVGIVASASLTAGIAGPIVVTLGMAFFAGLWIRADMQYEKMHEYTEQAKALEVYKMALQQCN